MLVQDLLCGCGWIWVPFAALCLLIQPGAVPRWGRVALLSPPGTAGVPCSWPHRDLLWHQATLTSWSSVSAVGKKCCQRLKWSHSPPCACALGALPVLLLPGPLRSGCQHGSRASAPAPLGALCGTHGITGGSQDARCPPPGAAQQQKELGTCPWHVLQTEVRLSPAAPRCSAGGIQAHARACGWVPHTVPCKAANSGWSVPKWHFQSHQPWHSARRGVGMQSCAQPPCPRDAWCHPPVPPDPSWEQAGAISSGGARFRPRKL